MSCYKCLLICRYIDNIPIAILLISLLLIAPLRISHYYRNRRPVNAEVLTSPLGESRLVRLESSVILSAVAENLLRPTEKGDKEKLQEDDAEEVVEEFVHNETKSSRRWAGVKWGVGLVGGAAFVGVNVAAAVLLGDWKRVIFPVSWSQ